MKTLYTLMILLLPYCTIYGNEIFTSKLNPKAKLKTSHFKKQLHFKFDDHAIILTKVKIKGSDKTYQFQLDTGADYSYISSEIANDIHFQSSHSDKVSDGFKTEEQYLGALDLSIEGISFEKVECAIFNFKTNAFHIDGIIGLNLIKSCVWQIGSEKIVITDNVKNITERDKYFAQKLYNGENPIASFVNGYIATMMIDLGDNGNLEIPSREIDWIKSKSIATGEGAVLNTMSGEKGTEAHKKYQHLLVKGFILGRDTIPNLEVYTSLNEDVMFGYIGAGILDYVDLILDLKKRKIYSCLKEKQPKNSIPSSLGFKFKIEDHQVFVKFLWDHSSAIENGIKLGDKITAIDGVEITSLQNLSTYELRAKIKKELLKKTLRLKIERMDHEVTLKRKELF